MKPDKPLVSSPALPMFTDLRVFTEVTFQLIEFCSFEKKYQSQNHKRPDNHHSGIGEKKNPYSSPPWLEYQITVVLYNFSTQERPTIPALLTS